MKWMLRNMNDAFLADTYALIEIAGGNRNYEKFRESKLVSTQQNLMEFYYYFLRESNEDRAEKELQACIPFAIPVTWKAVRAAMKFKYAYRSEKLSYIDCIGYALACELGIPFLTGDCKFEGKPNVAFVK
ncbi:PIN domain-containing protein [Candidatus Woesearchaeota archaeon]|nr:PIN domain-containing protein [Candidatus Woesearchaeota archaeon]